MATSFDEWYKQGGGGGLRKAATETEPGMPYVPDTKLGKIFDTISRPGYSTVGSVYEPIKSVQETGEWDYEDFARGFMEGLKGKEYSVRHVLYALDTHKKFEQHMSQDSARYLTIGLGFLGDVLFDWSNLAFPGVAKGIRVAGKAAGKTAFAQAAKNSRALTGFRQIFDASAGLPKEYYELKYFARHAFGAEMDQITRDIEHLAKSVSVKDRSKIMDALASGSAPKTFSHEERALFSTIQTRLQDIGKKWVDGGWMSQKRLRQPYEPRYYLMRDEKTGKWIVPTSGPHGVPTGMFDKVASPSATKARRFNTSKEAEEYYQKKGYLGEYIDVGRDPLYGFALRASEQARFFAHQKFTDDVLEKFGTRVDIAETGIEGVKSGTLEYKVLKAASGDGFYMPKGALKMYQMRLIPQDALRKELKVVAEKMAKAENPQALEKLMDIARKDMLENGYIPDEIDRILDVLRQAGGKGVENVLGEVSNLREAIGEIAKMEGDLIDLGKLEDLIQGGAKTLVGVSKKVPIYKMPKSVADDLNKLKLIESDEGMGILRRGFDAALHWWKGTATSMNPGFHFRNSYSNMFNMWLGGVAPIKMANRMKQGVAIQMKRGGPVKLPDGTMLSVADIAEETRRLGVRGKGWIAADMPNKYAEDLEKALAGGKVPWKQRINPLSGEFGLLAGGRWFGTAVEDAARIGLYIDRRVKGDDMHKAALHVKKYLFDYSELTNAERTIFKRVWPFYTWMRKNTPLQFETLIMRGGKYTATAKAMRAIGAFEPETDAEKASRPDYFDDLNAIKAPKFFKDLLKSGNPLYINPNLPFQDINRTEMQEFFSSLNPLIKVSLELGPTAAGLPGWKAFSKRPLAKYPGERDPLPGGLMWLDSLPEGMKEILGIGPTLSYMHGQMVPGMEARLLHVLKNVSPFFMNVAKAAPTPEGLPQDVKERWRYHMLSWVFGIKMMPLDVAKARTIKLFKTQKKYEQLKKYLSHEEGYKRPDSVEKLYGIELGSSEESGPTGILDRLREKE